MYRRVLATCLMLSIVLLAFFLPRSSISFAAPSIQGLHISGNTILNGANQPIRLWGINRSGTEYACIQNNGIFDGPSDATSVQAMTTWKINVVRVPLNEDCWLNINGVNPAFGGANYQQAIVNYVNLLNSNGLIAIVELHWSAPGSTPATGQNPMPDMDHSPAFWTSVANTFKNNSSVIFDLFNEPFPDNNSDTAAGWNCWKNGGTCSGVNYQVAGMQTLVNTVRATGATNIIALGGLQFSNALSQWLANKPSDPTGNLIAAWHSYNFNICSNTSCWNTNVAPVIAQVPLLVGEIGENDCAHGYIDGLMNFLDAHSTGYLGWAWNANFNCNSGPALISNYNGTPTNFGIGLRDHLAVINSGATPTRTPTRTSTATPTRTPTRTPTATATQTTGASCQVTYTIQSQWDNGLVVNPLTIKNTGSAAINGWTLAWAFAGNQQITNAWGIVVTQTGQSVSARNETWDATIPSGGTVTPGFQATYSGTNARPNSFRLNGAACSVTP
jgi:hypothetical protein